MKVNLYTIAIMAIVLLIVGMSLLVYSMYCEVLNRKLQVEQFGYYDSRVCLLPEEQIRIQNICIVVGLVLSFSSIGLCCVILKRPELN